MKQLLTILVVIITLSSCSSDRSGQRQVASTPKTAVEVPAKEEVRVKRLVVATFGVNRSVKVLRYVDTIFHVGDTIKVDMSGISSVNEAVIVR